MISVFILTMDEIWYIIIRKVSYIDKIQLGRTSKKFFVLVNSSKQIRQIQEHLSHIFKSSFDSFLQECFQKLKLQYDSQYGDKCNRLYFYWFLSLLYENINCRFIYGHLFWCKRYGAMSSECKLCCQAVRNYILDEPQTFSFLRYKEVTLITLKKYFLLKNISLSNSIRNIIAAHIQKMLVLQTNLYAYLE